MSEAEQIEAAIREGRVTVIPPIETAQNHLVDRWLDDIKSGRLARAYRNKGRSKNFNMRRKHKVA